MQWGNLAAFGLRHVPAMIPLAVGLLSVLILFGCAIASWVAPSEKKDCIFHREVV